MIEALLCLWLSAAETQVSGWSAISASQSAVSENDARIEIPSGVWKLQGNFKLGNGNGPRPTVLLLNKANGNRQAYETLATELARRGVNSLRIDLRGHGESINAGKFVPFDEANNAKIFIDEYTDVVAAMQWLRSRNDVDQTRLAVVGASYSAEVAVDAARREGKFAKAYALLSPGSLSEESAKGIDPSGARWLVIRAAKERSPSVKAAAERVAALSTASEVRVVDSDKHATDLLESVPELTPWLAYWLQQSLLR